MAVNQETFLKNDFWSARKHILTQCPSGQLKVMRRHQVMIAGTRMTVADLHLIGQVKLPKIVQVRSISLPLSHYIFIKEVVRLSDNVPQITNIDAQQRTLLHSPFHDNLDPGPGPVKFEVTFKKNKFVLQNT